MADAQPRSTAFDNVPDPAGEPSQIQELAELTEKLLDMRYPTPDKILRGVHPKSHGCVKATFQINRDIDKDLRVGLFANPGKYDAWIRFSNASSRVEPDLKDGENGSRGMAIKVLDVVGRVLQDDRGKHNQDFLMINTPAFAFANVEDYLRLNQILLQFKDDSRPFFAPLGGQVPGFTPEQIGRIAASLGIVQLVKSIVVANPLEVQYFSAAPFLYGQNHVMKFSAAPCGDLKPQVLPANPSENYLREAVAETMSKGEDICFDFKVQVRGKDDPDLGIEDATTVWDEAQTPFVNVAKITIKAPQKGIGSPKEVKQCENLHYTPWQSLVEHQPVGGINRLRKNVYVSSGTHRLKDEGKRPGRGGGRGLEGDGGGGGRGGRRGPR